MPKTDPNEAPASDMLNGVTFIDLDAATIVARPARENAARARFDAEFNVCLANRGKTAAFPVPEGRTQRGLLLAYSKAAARAGYKGKAIVRAYKQNGVDVVVVKVPE